MKRCTIFLCALIFSSSTPTYASKAAIDDYSDQQIRSSLAENIPMYVCSRANAENALSVIKAFDSIDFDDWLKNCRLYAQSSVQMDDPEIFMISPVWTPHYICKMFEVTVDGRIGYTPNCLKQ